MKFYLCNLIENLLKKSKIYDYQFVSAIQKTMLILEKGFNEKFDSDIVLKTGLKSYAYHITTLLLEESLFNLEINEGEYSKLSVN